MSDKIVYAATTAAVSYDGAPVILRPGQPWRADHPVVKKHPSLFSENPTAVRGAEVVEQATAAPGERRVNVRRS